jgi:hypothetical protein
VDELKQALGHIADVRAQMSASTQFRGFAPEAVAASALLAIGTATVQSQFANVLNASPSTFVIFWAFVAVVAIVIIGGEAVGRARRLHGTMADGMLNSALHLLMPPLATGALITFVLWRTAPQEMWLLAGLWQMLIGLAGFGALPMLSSEMRWAGMWYIASGTVSLILAEPSPPLSPWLMGIPFCFGQLIVAAVLRRANETAYG